jgi:hypothetical protein
MLDLPRFWTIRPSPEEKTATKVHTYSDGLAGELSWVCWL